MTAGLPQPKNKKTESEGVKTRKSEGEVLTYLVLELF